MTQIHLIFLVLVWIVSLFILSLDFSEIKCVVTAPKTRIHIEPKFDVVHNSAYDFTNFLGTDNDNNLNIYSRIIDKLKLYPLFDTLTPSEIMVNNKSENINIVITALGTGSSLPSLHRNGN